MQKNKRIVIFNVNWLGDVLFSTPVIRALRQSYPQAYLACIIPARCLPVLEANPYLDEIIFFDDRSTHKSLFAKINFIFTLKKRRFDTAILLHGSLTRALISKLAGIPERIGYDTKRRGFLLTRKINPPRVDSLHRVDYYLGVIQAWGVKPVGQRLDLFLDPNDQKGCDDFLGRSGLTPDDIIVGINPGGNWLPKRWPTESWKKLSDKLIADLGVKVVVTGGLEDLAFAEEIAHGGGAVIAAGKLNLRQSAALFKRLNIFICADTGPLHIANAVGAKKIIALFGPTDACLTGPIPDENVCILQKNIGCTIPCYQKNCPDNRCMKAIGVDEVFTQVRKMIGVN